MISEIQHLGLIDEDALELDKAALDLARLDHPNHDVTIDLALIDRMIDRVRSKIHDLDGESERAVWLSGVLAGEFGFDGDRETYDAAENADLISVLERRRGLPVTLALLYVAIARRVGWQAHVLDTPGHALMAIDGSRPIVLDPFNGGGQISGRSLASPPPGQEIRLEHLRPMTNRAVLVRLLVNQANRAVQARQFARALTVIRRVTTVAPGYSSGWWERARLEIATDDREEARKSLNSMLETTKNPQLRAQVLEALKTV